MVSSVFTTSVSPVIRDLFSSGDATLQRGIANRYIPDASHLEDDELQNRISESLHEIYGEPNDIEVYALAVINPYPRNEYGSDYGSFTIIADMDHPDEAKEIVDNLDQEIVNNCKIMCVKHISDTVQDEEWEPRADSYYYGDIPEDTTRGSLVDIMANGLYNFVKDAREHGWTSEQIGDAERLSSNLLDLWLEHDANDQNRFDHLVPVEDIDEFCQNVKNELILLDPTLA